MVTFILLSVTVPFYSDNLEEMFDQILANNYSFDDDGWQNVSYNGMDFVRKLLVTDPTKRMDYEEARKHPWLTNDLEKGNQ